MNFLAHCVLAGEDADLIAGAIAGDFIKGIIRDTEWPGRMALGLRLHRRIDAFSNADPGLRASAARFGPRLRRIAPPIVDVWADHVLASQLATATLTPPGALEFEDYADGLAGIALSRADALPDRCVEFLQHAERTRLFRDYRQPARIERVITHVCQRLGRAEDARQVLDRTVRHAPELARDFAEYWPRLQAEATRFLATAA